MYETLTYTPGAVAFQASANLMAKHSIQSANLEGDACVVILWPDTSAYVAEHGGYEAYKADIEAHFARAKCSYVVPAADIQPIPVEEAAALNPLIKQLVEEASPSTAQEEGDSTESE